MPVQERARTPMNAPHMHAILVTYSIHCAHPHEPSMLCYARLPAHAHPQPCEACPARARTPPQKVRGCAGQTAPGPFTVRLRLPSRRQCHRHQCHRHSRCRHRRPQPPATIASTSSLASNLRHRHLQSPLPPATDTTPPPSQPPPATAAASHRRQPLLPATVRAVFYVHQLCSLSAIYFYTSGNEATHRGLQRVPATLGRTDSGIDSSY